jgi:hypothetical protein
MIQEEFSKVNALMSPKSLDKSGVTHFESIMLQTQNDDRRASQSMRNHNVLTKVNFN